MRALVVLALLAASTGVVHAAVNVTPSIITAPITNVGVQSAQSNATTISNSGGGNPNHDLVIGTCTGSGAGTFALSATSIDLSSPTMVTVRYTPTSAGSRTCTVSVRDNSGTTQATFTIAGSGQSPATMAVGAVSAFGNLRVFDNAVAAHTSTRNLTVTNSGGASLNITNVTLTGDYSIDAGSATGTAVVIPGGQSRTWTLRFDPTAVGTRTGTITFTSSNAGMGMANLTGDGTSGAMTTAIANNGNFGTVAGGSTAAVDVTLTHSGTVPRGIVTIKSAIVTPDDGTKAWFALSGVPSTIVNATPGTLTVTCSPPVNTTMTATGVVTIRADVDGSPGPSYDTTYTHAVSCTGGASTLALSTASVDFGSHLIGTTSASQTFMLTNTGNQPASVSFSSASANRFFFTLATPGQCGTGANPACDIAPGSNVQVTAQFSPNAEATTTAGFTVASGGPSLGFTLTGRGTDRHLEIADLFVSVPDTYRGAERLVDLPLRNAGEYPIIVSELVLEGQPTWSIAEPSVPFMIDALATVDVKVAFRPIAEGKADDGQLLILNDDTKVMSGMPRVILSGNGIARRVDVGPAIIDLGDRAVGVATRLTDIARDMPLLIANNDELDFQIREIRVDGDRADEFTVVDLDDRDVSNLPLPVGTAESFDVVWTPTREGELDAVLGVYFDEDPQAASVVLVRGRALSVDIRGGGGCSTGRGAGPLVLLALLVLRRRRYR